MIAVTHVAFYFGHFLTVAFFASAQSSHYNGARLYPVNGIVLLPF